MYTGDGDDEEEGEEKGEEEKKREVDNLMKVESFYSFNKYRGHCTVKFGTQSKLVTQYQTV